MSRLQQITSIVTVIMALAWTVSTAAKDSKQPLGKGVPALNDLYGDPLPLGASARLGTVRLRHSDAILATTISPDGTLIASLGMDGCIRLWNTATGKQFLQANLDEGLLSWLARPYTLAFSGDGKILAVGACGRIAFWSIDTGATLRYLPEQEQYVHGLVFAPGDKVLAVFGSSNDVSLLDPASEKKQHKLKGHTDKVLSAAFSADGKILATGGADYTCRLWSVSDGREVRKLDMSNRLLQAVNLAFSQDGRLLGWGDQEGTVHLWDLGTGKEKDSFSVSKRRVYGDHPIGSLQFHADGRFLAWGNAPPSLYVWHANKGLQRRSFEHLFGDSYYGRLAPDSRSVALWAENSRALRLLNLDTGREREQVRGHWNCVTSLSVAPIGGLIASGSWDGTIRVWDRHTSQELCRWKGHEGQIPSLAFAPDGKVLASCAQHAKGWGGTIRLWDIATGRELRSFPTEATRFISFSRDGKLLFVAGECRVQIWDPTRGKLIREMEAVAEAKEPPVQIDRTAPRLFWHIIALAHSPHGKTVAAVLERAGRQKLYVWDASTGEKLSERNWLYAPIAFSPDGETLAAVKKKDVDSRDWEVILWEAATGKERGHIPLQQQGCHSVAFSSDGKLLAVGNYYNGAIHVWSLALGKEVACFRGHSGRVLVAFSPEGTKLISGSDDSTLLVWDLQSISSQKSK